SERSVESSEVGYAVHRSIIEVGIEPTQSTSCQDHFLMILRLIPCWGRLSANGSHVVATGVDTHDLDVVEGQERQHGAGEVGSPAQRQVALVAASEVGTERLQTSGITGPRAGRCAAGTGGPGRQAEAPDQLAGAELLVAGREHGTSKVDAARERGLAGR